MLIAGIKAVSLAYLLGMLALGLASGYWYLVSRYVAPRHRAATSFWLICVASTLSLAGTLYILLGVVSYRIIMSTNLFHRLMYGGWGVAITTAGLVIFAVSLLLAFISWRRGGVPRAGHVLDERDGIRIRLSAVPQTASLVGVRSPEIWVNEEYWAGLDQAGKNAAIEHELEHLRRGDNFGKLIVQFISTLYFLLPWMRSWPGRFDLYCEYAVDYACRGKLGASRYFNLISSAAKFILQQNSSPVASHLGQSDIARRLSMLKVRPVNGSTAGILAICVAGIVISVTPELALLLHPVPRCLLACYLGY